MELLEVMLFKEEAWVLKGKQQVFAKTIYKIFYCKTKKIQIIKQRLQKWNIISEWFTVFIAVKLLISTTFEETGYNITEKATCEIRAYLHRQKNAEVMYTFKVCLGHFLALLFPRLVGFYVKTLDFTSAASLN